MYRPPHRPGSRPDIPREEPESTPPRGVETSRDAIGIVRDELRDMRARMGTAEERIDKLEDWTENSKVTHLRAKKRTSWWIERASKVGETIAAALLLFAIAYAISRLACVQPTTKVELHQ
jgi:hypothetical protein